MVFAQILEAWNQHQVIAAQGKDSSAKPEGRGFGIDITKLGLPARGQAPAPYGGVNRSNTSQGLGGSPAASGGTARA